MIPNSTRVRLNNYTIADFSLQIVYRYTLSVSVKTEIGEEMF